MKILIDTHILIWTLEGNKRLSQTIRSQMLEAETIFVSVVSIWECAIKAGLNKLNLNITDLLVELDSLGIKILPIKPEHLVHFSKLPLLPRDPFDRMLIAQAQTEPLILITEDVAMQDYF